jgi:7-cyano-7-deazaguanine synthase
VVQSDKGQGVAVLCSGGLDSAVLLATVAGSAAAEGLGVVHPVYVSVGLAWEQEERAMLGRLLQAPAFRGAAPVASLHFDMRDVYPPSHWAVRGEAPGFDTPDEDVYLDGRNIVLLAKAAVYMARARLIRVYVGPLAGNPFPDATPEFFDAMARAMSLGLASKLEVAAPFAAMSKAEVIASGRRLGVPLELTLSCMQPSAGLHCGRCSKCRERRDAFIEAGGEDPTRYAVRPQR